MIIKCHRKLTVNLKLFLEKMGYECYYNRSFDNFDEILVANVEHDDLLKRVEQYASQWGFIPYHFALKLKKKGKRWKSEKVETVAKLSQLVEFEALQGNFQLILFDSKDGNFLWKTYSVQDVSDTQKILTGKLKAVIQGAGEEVINLISHCRIKEK